MNARGVASLGARLIALVIALAPANEACAHASLVKAVPADGAVMPLPPATLTLTFNEPVSPLVVRLIGPDGAPIAPTAVTAEDTTITISAPPALRRGTHVLSWRVISADGHPVSGSLMFSIGARSPAAQPENLADRSVRVALWAGRVVIYVALFVGAGGAFFAAWIADGAARRAWIVFVLAAGLVAVALSLGLQGLDALDLPLSGLRHKLAWEAGLATSYGATAVVAALALLLAVFGCAARSASTARAFSLVGVIGAGLALSLSGHASAAAPQLLNRPAVFLHAVCVAFWIGSLLPLYLAVRSERVRGPHSIGARSAGVQLARFSRAIPLVIVLLAASGLWLAFVQLDRLAAPWTTSYGQLLACKLACVAVLLALAAANRYRLVPKFETGAAAACACRRRADLVASARREGDGRDRDRTRRRGGGREAAAARRRVSAARGQGGHAGAGQSRRRDRAHAADGKTDGRDELADRRSAHSGRRPMDARRRNPDQRFRQGDGRGHGRAAVAAVMFARYPSIPPRARNSSSQRM